MTRHELLQLKRSSLLAIKAYFSASLEPRTAECLSHGQLAAANFMHQAACRELDGPDHLLLPAYAIARLGQLAAELNVELERKTPNQKHLLALADRLREFVAQAEEPYTDNNEGVAGEGK